MLNLLLLLLFSLLCLWAVFRSFRAKGSEKTNPDRTASQNGADAASKAPGPNSVPDAEGAGSGLLSFLVAHERGLAIFALAVGILIRISFFWIVPDGLNQDEASVSYDAFADLTYGMDRNGDHNPVYSVAWGSGHSSLYITLTKLWIALFGLNVFTARVTNVLFGVVGLFAFYGVMKRLDRRAAVVGLFLFAVCPWHIMMCRWGLDCNLFPNVFLLGLYFLLRGLDAPRWYPLSLLVFGLSLYAYGASYITVPLFLLLSAAYLLYHKKITWKMAALSAGIFVAVALPLGIFMLINLLGLERLDLGFLTFPRLVRGRYYTTVTLLDGDPLRALYTNFRQFLRLLFLQDDGLIWNAIPAYGTLYLFSAPFWLVGACCVLRHVRGGFRAQTLVLFLALAALLLGCVSRLNINRANFIFLPQLIFLSLGVTFVLQNAQGPGLAVLPAYLCAFLLFCGTYFTSYRAEVGRSFDAGAGEAIVYASQQTDGTVYLTKEINAPYITAMFYLKTDPKRFLDTVVYEDPDSECRYVLSFDRYVTGLPNARNRSPGDAFVLSASEKSLFDSEDYDLKSFGSYYVATEKQE